MHNYDRYHRVAAATIVYETYVHHIRQSLQKLDARLWKKRVVDLFCLWAAIFEETANEQKMCVRDMHVFWILCTNDDWQPSIQIEMMHTEYRFFPATDFCGDASVPEHTKTIWE